MKAMDLSIEFCGVKCENPFFLSSSPVGNCYEMCAKALETGWGGIVFKTIGFFAPKEVSPRFDNLRKESTPFLGFKNMEQIAEHSLKENLEAMRRLKEDYPSKVLVASIMGQNESEWTNLAELVTKIGADIIECNFSCPQMTSHDMGSDVGQNPELVKKYCEAVKKGTNLPILAKMTPNIGNMTIPAIASIEGGATGIATINTIKCISGIDLDNMVGLPVINGKSSVSGYSGKAVKPIALRFIHELKTNEDLKNIPVSGIGGIETWEDAIEFILLGSTNLQVTTSVMQYGYRIVEDMISGVSYYMKEKGFKKLQDMVGLALKNIISAEELDRDYIVYPKFDMDKCVGCGRCYISCYDGGHQAIEWDSQNRSPILNEEKCVGCHLCSNVCPVQCINKGKIKFKQGATKRKIMI
ncbi:NAD-dependent dihydropyrimidine dehydrogenase subunit PreA [Clostridium botulinum]|uniref:NAD-dependent dihydropyrimidine dehydrogenase subunit PreA n=1 Tax=Clostridium botulinum TaxID=1491 RepID=UPI0004D8ED8D|nr:NAD-dependent dihydropyrimidine dehydrogenase subunit PreA [Clostridium botulinum]KEI05448.1 dihydropyrimidine dehydrogenase [Clostridium botulinum C/D str. BKT75002]KEI09399.1 dihydropyrimidine dehydrogenase [Clostridium botulinum C/D str. BKT2873]MCD3349419.1 NAD-dependent dihydropyrimidine dehydrogenase subunit PreA [Clostridium botulinum D/C]MCD3358590.1 NAD-dependent dihydropyrimidine dehydrogenase subunit PreA [Clostridium botulinum D/C]MCD3363726.1 NAD-dependent dihydropyrimidine deh